MTNHVHLLVTPQTADGIGVIMRRLGQRYVQYINRTYKRSATAWEGRYNLCMTSGEACVLVRYRFSTLRSLVEGELSYNGLLCFTSLVGVTSYKRMGIWSTTACSV